MKELENYGKYVEAQLKRVCRIFPTIIITTLVLLLCMALLMWVILEKNASSDKKQLVQIGLTGDLEGSYLGIGIQTIQNLDSSRFAISFENMTEEEAREKLMQGKISAYVIIPEGFVESVSVGENLPVTYVTSTGAGGVGSMVMNELVDMISGLITESQNAIYGAQMYMTDEGMWEIFWEKTDALYLRIVNFILGRTQVYELEILGVANRLSIVGYYVCAVLVLFLLLWGIVCSPLFVKRSESLSRLLKARGQGAVSQVLGEYTAYVVLMQGTLLLVFVLLAAVMPAAGIGLAEWEGEGSSRLFVYMIQIIPITLMISAMQFLLYEIVHGMVGSIFAQFLVAISMGYLSGCFYPMSFFPESIRRISRFLPAGAAVEYAGKCMLSLRPGSESIIMGMYWIVFLMEAVLVRRYKIKGN